MGSGAISKNDEERTGADAADSKWICKKIKDKIPAARAHQNHASAEITA